MQIKLICILWDTGGKASYTFPSCVHADFSASDANPVQSPLAEFCVPCVPSGTGGTLLSQPSHKTTQAPCSPPGGPFWPSFTPGGGTTRPSPVRGRFGPHRGEFGRSHRRSRKAIFRFLLLSGWKQNTPYHAFYVLAIYTGCRRGELCALRWSDFSFADHYTSP